MHVSPVAMSREKKKKMGEVEMAKVLQDGSLFVTCTTNEQKNKALQIKSLCKKTVSEVRILGERRIMRGEITFLWTRIWRDSRKVFVGLR